MRLILNGVEHAQLEQRAAVHPEERRDGDHPGGQHEQPDRRWGGLRLRQTRTTDEPNAAIFSAADLTIFGGGTLTVQGNNNDGIASKDGLIIAGGTISVTAVDDGIRGKDYLVIEDGAITVEAGGDGLKSDNAEDTSQGLHLYRGRGVEHHRRRGCHHRRRPM